MGDVPMLSCTNNERESQQISESESKMNGNDDDDNGYSSGLNKASLSDKNESNSRHEKLMSDNDHRNNFKMTVNDNNDLLEITPDQTGRLQTNRQQQQQHRHKK